MLRKLIRRITILGFVVLFGFSFLLVNPWLRPRCLVFENMPECGRLLRWS
jgi:hypothetical protein